MTETTEEPTTEPTAPAVVDDPSIPVVPPNPPAEVDESVPVVALEHAAAVLSASDAKTDEIQKAADELKADAPPEAERPPDPKLMSEEEAKAITMVDIIGNGPGFLVNVSESGLIIPFASGLQLVLTPQGAGAVFAVPTGFVDGPDVDPTQRRIKVTTVRACIRKMLICTRPSSIRLRNHGDEWWTAASAMLKTMPNTDTFTEAPVMFAPPPAPEETAKETADVQPDTPAETQPQP